VADLVDLARQQGEIMNKLLSGALALCIALGAQLAHAQPRNLIVELRVGDTSGSASIDWGGQVTESGQDGNKNSAGGWSVGTESNPAQQTLQVLDGHSGYIALSQSRPLPWRLIGPRGRAVTGIDYREAVSGLYVRPQLVGGGRVRVDAAVSDSAFAGNRQNSLQLMTTVEGRLGTWLTLGSIAPDAGGSATLLLGGHKLHAHNEQSVQLRVRPAEE
jgi:hypothetical protein